MPTIPLYAEPSHPDAWHQVRSPGGYESWYFDADDPQNDRHFVVILSQGCMFHPGYLRRYSRYRRFPTHFCPPLPSSYPCAHFALYERGAVRCQFMSQYAPGAFHAATDRPQFEIGPNQMAFDGTRFNLHLQGNPSHLTWRGPRPLNSQLLEARFTFTPRLGHQPLDQVLRPKVGNAEHHWIMANPLCDVEGAIQVGAQPMEFRGRGYHDHHWGTAPLGLGLKRWFRGRVLLEDRAYTFRFARPRDRALPDEIQLLEACAQSIRQVPITSVLSEFSRRTRLLLDYPARLALDDILELTNPRVIDSGPCSVRLTYDAQLPLPNALCEIVYPQRLRWPMVGRAVEMAIAKRAWRAG